MARQSTSELAERIRALVHEYDERICNAEAVGALEIVKHDLIEEANDQDQDREY